MGASSKSAVLGASKTIFEALAPYLIENGVTSSEAVSLLRAVCVHEAARSFVQLGRRPNVSKVSIKTGVERHLVADILKTAPRVDGSVNVSRNATSRVVVGWRSNRSYLKNGRPRALPVGDPRSRGRSVWKLVERYAPGIWPRLVIDELIRVDLVDVLSDGTLRCNVGHPSSNSVPPWSTRRATPQLLRDAIYSQLTDMKAGGHRRSWRATQSVLIAEDKAPLVRRMVRERLDSTVAELADELHSPRWKGAKNNEQRRVLIGINAFSFERSVSCVDGQDSDVQLQASRGGRARRRRGI